jgi:uncharacterized protein with PQ loop repeat
MGLVNVAAMLPQLYQLVTTHKTEGLNVLMFWIYLIIQIAFSLQGFFRRDQMLMWCLGLSALVTAANIFCIYLFSS